jgi:hypothetical protein
LFGNRESRKTGLFENRKSRRTMFRNRESRTALFGNRVPRRTGLFGNGAQYTKQVYSLSVSRKQYITHRRKPFLDYNNRFGHSHEKQNSESANVLDDFTRWICCESYPTMLMILPEDL